MNSKLIILIIGVTFLFLVIGFLLYFSPNRVYKPIVSNTESLTQHQNTPLNNATASQTMEFWDPELHFGFKYNPNKYSVEEKIESAVGMKEKLPTKTINLISKTKQEPEIMFGLNVGPIGFVPAPFRYTLNSVDDNLYSITDNGLDTSKYTEGFLEEGIIENRAIGYTTEKSNCFVGQLITVNASNKVKLSENDLKEADEILSTIRCN